MASEPELRTGDGGEWVLYLQQSLNHHYRQQVTGESGEFDAALAGVVRHFQAQQGLPETGDVDTATWQALSGTRYRWPDEPVATAEVTADGTVVRLALTLTGEVGAGGVDALADLTVDLATEPPALACTGATFIPGFPEVLADGVEYTGTCALPGAADATGYVLAVMGVPDVWPSAGTVALPATTGLVEVTS